jgi:hypothetical protein
VNWLSKFARGLPYKSVTPLVTTTVTVLDAGSPFAFSVTTRLSAEMLIPKPVDGTPFNSKPKLVALIVVGFSDFEKVKTTGVFRLMPVDAFVGVTATIVGAVVSVPVPVENLPEYEVLPFPDKSNTPPELTCTWIVAFPGNGDKGVNVSTAPVVSRE